MGYQLDFMSPTCLAEFHVTANGDRPARERSSFPHQPPRLVVPDLQTGDTADEIGMGFAGQCSDDAERRIVLEEVATIVRVNPQLVVLVSDVVARIIERLVAGKLASANPGCGWKVASCMKRTLPSSGSIHSR